MEKVWRVERKSGKMVKMVMVLYFFKAATSALTGKFSFRFGQILFHLAHSFAIMQEALFVHFSRSLRITYFITSSPKICTNPSNSINYITSLFTFSVYFKTCIESHFRRKSKIARHSWKKRIFFLFPFFFLSRPSWSSCFKKLYKGHIEALRAVWIKSRHSTWHWMETAVSKSR